MNLAKKDVKKQFLPRRLCVNVDPEDTVKEFSSEPVLQFNCESNPIENGSLHAPFFRTSSVCAVMVTLSLKT